MIIFSSLDLNTNNILINISWINEKIYSHLNKFKKKSQKKKL